MGGNRIQSRPVNVPILDLGRVRQRIATQLDERWRRILDQTSFILGPEVKEFEAAFASYLGVEACVGLANGTDALIIGLRALGLKPGDEVIVPAFSFFATAEAVAWLGGKVVFCDVDPESLNLSPADVEARVTERTVGIIGVHLYGRPFDVDALVDLCAAARPLAARGRGAGARGRMEGEAGGRLRPARGVELLSDQEPRLLRRRRRGDRQRPRPGAARLQPRQPRPDRALHPPRDRHQQPAGQPAGGGSQLPAGAARRGQRPPRRDCLQVPWLPSPASAICG